MSLNLKLLHLPYLKLIQVCSRLSLMNRNLLMAFMAVFLLPTFASAEMNEAGMVNKVRGDVSLIREGQSLDPKAKDLLYSGDLVTTGKRGLLVAHMLDESRFFVGNNAEMTITEIKYSGQADDRVEVNIARGAFRFATGLIAKENPDAIEIQLGNLGHIGLRGTSVAGEILDGSADVMLLEPEEDADKATAIIVSNDYGQVLIDKPGWGTTIPDEHSPPSPPRRMRLRAIENLTRSLGTGSRAMYR